MAVCPPSPPTSYSLSSTPFVYKCRDIQRVPETFLIYIYKWHHRLSRHRRSHNTIHLPFNFQIPTSTVTMPYFTITATFSNFPAAVTGGLTSTCHRIPAMVSTDHCLMCSIQACTTQRYGPDSKLTLLALSAIL